MPHIALDNDFTGIRSLMAFRPDTAKPLNELIDVLLRDEHVLTAGERELIATFVSYQNDCRYCHTMHGAVAARHLDGDEELVERVKAAPETAAISEKLKALLAIAGRVVVSGQCVREIDIARARRHGATDQEVHDTVLIAAVFCLCNRYVEGLAAITPTDPDFYQRRAEMLVERGYAAATASTPTAASGRTS